MNVSLIPMDRANVSAVAAIERECFTQPWSEDMLAQELYNEMASYILAVDGEGEALGYAALSVVLDEGSLDRIAVREQFRRRGVADALLDAFVRFGRVHLAFLTLEVRASNAAAIALYRKHGFEEVGRRKNYYAAEHEDAVLMTLQFREEQENEP